MEGAEPGRDTFNFSSVSEIMEYTGFVYLALALLFIILAVLLFVLLTSISLAMEAKGFKKAEKSEFNAKVTVRWLFFSHTFSTEEFKIEDKENFKAEEKEALTKENFKTEEKENFKTDKKENFKTEEREGLRAEEKFEAEERDENKAGKRADTKDLDQILKALKALRFLSEPLLQLFSGMIKAAKVKELDCAFAFGFSDPADTGMFSGFLHALRASFYPLCKQCRFSIEPVFWEEVLNFQSKVNIHIYTYSLVFTVINFIIARKTLSFIYLILREKLQAKWGHLLPRFKNKYRGYEKI